MSTSYNYAIVTVLNKSKSRHGGIHYLEVREYQYLEDAREDFKYDAVEVYKEAEEQMTRHDTPEPYHLEVVKLKWEGNCSTVVRQYTKR